MTIPGFLKGMNLLWLVGAVVVITALLTVTNAGRSIQSGANALIAKVPV